VLFDLRLLHGGATNYGDAPRRAVFAMYVRGWIKPMVDGRRSTPRDVIDTATPTLRRLLGFERQPVVIAENGRWAIEAAPGATSFYGRPQGAGVYG
jgi:ectoine hydroxylase-related dioxygenase (phytanoyl-CoA dioxygenase family)